MSVEHNLGPVAQIPAGEGRNFRVGDATIAVFLTHAGTIHATQPECPHRRGPLADGLIGGATVICPLHDRAWDLGTGVAVSGVGPDEVCQITVYPARILADRSVAVMLPR